ncbi:hypothetical protein Bbelb_157170 [Branchiostoma belcheri]|nr:hypothetical protein Bbelb_157170 [Branchiostoma belcheri]
MAEPSVHTQDIRLAQPNGSRRIAEHPPTQPTLFSTNSQPWLGAVRLVFLRHGKDVDGILKTPQAPVTHIAELVHGLPNTAELPTTMVGSRSGTRNKTKVICLHSTTWSRRGQEDKRRAADIVSGWGGGDTRAGPVNPLGTVRCGTGRKRNLSPLESTVNSRPLPTPTPVPAQDAALDLDYFQLCYL